MTPAVDDTQPWNALTLLAKDFKPDLATWFATDPARAERWTFSAGDLVVDLSKNLITDEIVGKLIELADTAGLADHRQAMFSGQPINGTENRAVLHTALRAPAASSLIVDGVDVIAQVHQELAKMYDFANQVRGGKWLGFDGQPIKTVVNIGIGGSDLGPVMVYEALQAYVDGPSVRFISNLDPSDLWLQTRGLDPATTLFIVSSKTFTTAETMTNASQARRWLINSLASRGLVDPASDQAIREATAKHFVAVSNNLQSVSDFGIDVANSFRLWDWVGGRYSVSSAVGLSCLLAVGQANWQAFLAGLHTIDQHFQNTAAVQNLPLLMGLLNIWYTNFLGAASHAVLPYQQALHRFPAYLQQLTMESNGKSVHDDGSPVNTDTGEIFWGEVGTNSQHAFFQLLHQGTRLIPADFIGLAKPADQVTEAGLAAHELYLSNFFAQTAALAFGRTADQVRAEGRPEELIPALVCPGNRPTTTILAPALTPSVLGQLVALYEHITFTQGVIWGINSFDQWGVELGKQLATQIAPALAGDQASLAVQDASTQSLITTYKRIKAEPTTSNLR